METDPWLSAVSDEIEDLFEATHDMDQVNALADRHQVAIVETMPSVIRILMQPLRTILSTRPGLVEDEKGNLVDGVIPDGVQTERRSMEYLEDGRPPPEDRPRPRFHVFSRQALSSQAFPVSLITRQGGCDDEYGNGKDNEDSFGTTPLISVH